MIEQTRLRFPEDTEIIMQIIALSAPKTACNSFVEGFTLLFWAKFLTADTK